MFTKLTTEVTISEEVLVSMVEKYQTIYGNMLTMIPAKMLIQRIKKMNRYSINKTYNGNSFLFEFEKNPDGKITVYFRGSFEMDDKEILDGIMKVETKILAELNKEMERFEASTAANA